MNIDYKTVSQNNQIQQFTSSCNSNCVSQFPNQLIICIGMIINYIQHLKYLI